MKTERMVLLVTPEEKARIGEGATKLGVSASEYIRKLVGLIDADDVAELESLAGLMPTLALAMDNMETNIARTMERFEDAEAERAYRRSDEYRAKVREDVLVDPSINWDIVRSLVSAPTDRHGEAA